MRKILFAFFLLCFLNMHGLEKTSYSFVNEPVDVIIPCTAKDLDTLDLCIDGIRQNCPHVRRIIVISKAPLSEKAEWFDENLFPFNTESIAYYLLKGDQEAANVYLTSPNPRVGWYYQQLLKLYAPFVIPNLTTNVLHLDSDTIFLNSVTFIDESGNGLYNPGTEFNPPYFTHMECMLPGLRKLYPDLSGISHHMLLQRSALENLFQKIESYHQTELWKAFCLFVDNKDLWFSGASSDEMYFNFVFDTTDQVKLRFLKWENIPRIRDIPYYQKNGYHYVSIHSWMREP